MDIQNVTVILTITIAFYLLTPGILIKIKGNKYFITLIHAILFGVVVILIQNLFKTTKESMCPEVPNCVNKATYKNTVWPWGKKDGTIDNGSGNWTGCGPRTIASTGQNPSNTVYKKDGKTPIRCPKIGDKPLGAFPYLIYDLPGTPGQNATVDPSAIARMNHKDRPCMYKLDQMCGYANAYDKNGNVIVGTQRNLPKCGSEYDRPTRIINNTNILACLADPQNVNGDTVNGDWTNPLFNPVKTGGVGATYYVSN